MKNLNDNDLEIVIEGGVPLLDAGNGSHARGKIRRTIDKLEVGESFQVPEQFDQKLKDARASCRKIAPDKKFAIRRQPDGASRIWRVR